MLLKIEEFSSRFNFYYYENSPLLYLDSIGIANFQCPRTISNINSLNQPLFLQRLHLGPRSGDVGYGEARVVDEVEVDVS